MTKEFFSQLIMYNERGRFYVTLYKKDHVYVKYLPSTG